MFGLEQETSSSSAKKSEDTDERKALENILSDLNFVMILS